MLFANDLGISFDGSLAEDMMAGFGLAEIRRQLFAIAIEDWDFGRQDRNDFLST